MRRLHLIICFFPAIVTNSSQVEIVPDIDKKTFKYHRHRHNSGRHLQMKPRIVNGNNAMEGRYDYQASVGKVFGEDGDNFQYLCSGSLAAPDMILLAAHCIVPDLGVQMGRHNLNDLNETYIQQKPKKTWIHPSYSNPVEDSHDVALMSFNSTFDGYPVVKISRPTRENILTNGQQLTVMGWGALDDSGTSFPDVKQVAKVYYEPSCGDYRRRWTSDDMMCAGGRGVTDTCYGDSGGPIVIAGKNATNDIQVGVVSWGMACASERYPGVYADLSNKGIYNWIAKMVCQNSEKPPADFDCDDLNVSPSEICNGDTGSRRSCRRATLARCRRRNFATNCCESCAKL